MNDVIATIRMIGEGFLTLADQLEASPPSKEESVTKETVESMKAAVEEGATEEKVAIKLEDVRAVLADISRSGKTAEMKALLAKFGASKLSDIDPAKYADLLAEAEAVRNA